MSNCVRCNGVFVVIFLKAMYNKTLNRFSFCDTWNNQGLNKCYQPWPSVPVITFAARKIASARENSPVVSPFLWEAISTREFPSFFYSTQGNEALNRTRSLIMDVRGKMGFPLSFLSRINVLCKCLWTVVNRYKSISEINRYHRY